MLGLAPVIRRSVAAADAADPDPPISRVEVDGLSAVQVGQPREHLALASGALFLEPDEVLVVALDKDRGAGRRASLGEPHGEVASAFVLARGLVDAVGVGPDAEVADVQDVVKAHAEGVLEREDIGVELVHGSMDVAGCADEHDVAMKARFPRVRKQVASRSALAFVVPTVRTAKAPQRANTISATTCHCTDFARGEPSKSPPLTRSAALSPRSPLQRANARRPRAEVIYATADAESTALTCTVANTRHTGACARQQGRATGGVAVQRCAPTFWWDRTPRVARRAY